MSLPDHDTGASLYEVAAELSATAGDIAANLSDARACPGLLARARDMLDTLAAEIGDTPDPAPTPSGWLAPRVLTYARARHALDANAIEEYEAGVCWDTPEFLRLNRAVADAETGVPGWVQAVAEWVIGRRLRYRDHIPNAAIDADADDWPLPVALTPKALAALGGDGARPPVVCLCGSTRFYDEFQQASYDLTMRGEIVLSVGFYPHATARHEHGEGVGHDSAAKTALDELHKRKIDLADYVLVLNPGGYVGLSTRSEIAYAAAHGKPVVYLQTGATDDTLTAEYQAAELFAAEPCRGNLR
jgi:hypothetical protein